jgi:hypothetical protein
MHPHLLTSACLGAQLDNFNNLSVLKLFLFFLFCIFFLSFFWGGGSGKFSGTTADNLQDFQDIGTVDRILSEYLPLRKGRK